MQSKFRIDDVVYCVEGERYIKAIVIAVIFDTNHFIYHVKYDESELTQHLDGYWDEDTLSF